MHRAEGRTHKATPRAQRLKPEPLSGLLAFRGRSRSRFPAAPVTSAPLGAGQGEPSSAAPCRAVAPRRSARPALAPPFYGRESCERLPPAAPDPPRLRLLSPPSPVAANPPGTEELGMGDTERVWGGFSSKLGIGPRRPHPAGKPLWRPHCGGTTHKVDTHPQANDGRAASRPAAWPQPPSRVPTPVPPSPLFPSPWGSKCPRMHRDGRSLQPQPHAALTALSSPVLAPMSAPMSGLMGTPRGKT